MLLLKAITSFSLAGSLVKDLLLEWSCLGESESDLVGGELMVAMSDGGESVDHNFLVQWI